MGTYTPNLNLYKPDPSDDLSDFRTEFNDNMDKLDNGGGGGSGGHTILDGDGNALPQEDDLQFTGACSVTDDNVNGRTVVDIKGNGLILDAQIYSDTEKVVGVWRDNKPLYQKTWDISDLIISYNSWTISSIPIGSMETIVNVLAINQSGKAFWGDAMASIEVDPTYIGFQTGRNGNVNERYRYVTIQYTKTTDTAGSGGFEAYGFSPVIFSDVERKIGVWRDNKPLYAKTINITTPSVANSIVSVADVTSLNIDTVVSLDGNYNDTNINWSLNIYFNTGRSANCFVNGGKTAIMMLVNDNVAMNKNAYVTIKYTKTTDVAGSGDYNTYGVPTVHCDNTEKVVGTWNGETLYERSFVYTGNIANGAWKTVDNSYSPANIGVFFLEHICFKLSGLTTLYASYSGQTLDVGIETTGKLYVENFTGETVTKVWFTMRYTKI